MLRYIAGGVTLQLPMSLKIFGRFDADSENVSAQESGVKDAEIVALGDQMGAGHFERLQTLNVVSL